MLKRLGAVFLSLFSILVVARGLKEYQHHQEVYGYGKSVFKLLGNGGGGTGFSVLYKGRPFTLTNDHVCRLASKSGKLLVISPYVAVQSVSVLFHSGSTDLCLMSPVEGLPTLKLGTTEFDSGEPLFIIGHPQLRPLESSHGRAGTFDFIDVMLGVIQTPADAAQCHLPKNRIVRVFFGMITACTAHVRAQHTTALIEPGSSGSPVLSMDGKVRGVAFASNYTKKAEIIPLKDILKFLDLCVRYVRKGHAR